MSLASLESASFSSFADRDLTLEIGPMLGEVLVRIAKIILYGSGVVDYDLKSYSIELS